MEIQAFLLSVLLLSILTGSETKSLDHFCAEKCTAGTRTLFQNNGYEYSYTYRTTVESSFHTESAHDQKARLSIEVPFTITANSECDLILQINRGMYIDNMTPRTQEELAWQEAVAAYPLYFSWQNGVVEQVCPSNDEPSWVLNFKKGILSALQVTRTNNASAVRELDVSGDCEADFFVQKGETTIIRKTKDFTKCTNRDKHLLFSWSMPYELNSPRQNYIHSQQTCQQTLNNVLQSVECNEEHVFRPFSTDEAGARTHITQHIQYLHQRRASSKASSRYHSRRTNLAYEDATESVVESMSDKTHAAEDLMTEICANMDREDYQNVGQRFISLVFAIRELDSDSLSELWNHINTCTEWKSSLRQMLSNSLPFCGTESCVNFASSLIMNDALEPTVAERWLTGFSFIKSPTDGMISSVMDIVESRKFTTHSFLTVGSMIQQFCQNSEDNCMNNRLIHSSIEVLTQHLGTNCHSPQTESQKYMLLSLHAIGNAGQMTSPGTLRRCIAESENSMEVRISAVNAYRRMSCGEDRSVLLATLQNSEEDSELRISSYTNLMQCPTPALLSNIKSLLEAEQNMQVGSFIWSHLSQLIESQDPLKHYIQVLLQGHTFKDFTLDPRKYSAYYEASVFSERLNSGVNAEANLVWSPKSFIPRGASVNFTVDLFGQAVNLFEVGGRIQGFESYLQSLLEPEAYAKRSSRKLQPFGSERSKNEDIGTKVDDTQASWYLRMFGKEVIYGNTAFEEPLENTAASNFAVDFASKFMSAEGYNYHDDSLILNSVHILPTGTGMPLQVAFNGSVTIDVNAAGKFKMQGLSWTEYMLKGKVTPRAAVVVAGSMTIDAHMRKTGIATESTAYTSTSISGHVKLSDGGRSVEMEVDSPYSRNMAFDFKHKLLKVEGEGKVDFKTSEISPDLNEYSFCTRELLGQRLCFNKHYNVDTYSSGASPSIIFPMDGELAVSAYMEKTDQGLTKYTLSGNQRTVYENDGDTIPTNMLIQFSFDTPGSVVDRAANLFASYSIPDKQFAARVEQGTNTMRMQGSYASNDGQQEIRLSAEVNRRIYRFEANVYTVYDEDRKEITASSVIQLPERSMSANARLLFNPGKRAQASFVMENVLPTPVVLKIDLQDKTQRKDRFSFSGNGKISVQPFINTEFLLEMDLKPKLDNMIFNLNYKTGGSPKHSILLHHKRENLGRKSETDWNIYHMLTSSQFTSLNHKVSVSHKYTRGATRSLIDVGYGSEIDKPNNPYKLEIRQEYNDASDSSSTRRNGHFSVNIPFADINREARFVHLHSKDILSTSIDSVVASNPYQFTFLWKNNAPGSHFRNSTIEMGFPTPYGDLDFVNTVEETVENVFMSKSSLSLGEMEELRFLQETVIVNTLNNKSIEVSMEKGDGSKIITLTSSNIAKLNNEYVSKNLIHVFGYEPRGLDIYHQRSSTKGYPTRINFLKSNAISLGMSTTYLTPDTGKHLTLEISQDDVQQRSVVVKAGYDYVKGLSFDTYASLIQNTSPLFSSHITLNHSTKSLVTGDISMELEKRLFSGKTGVNATLSFAITDNRQITLSQRLNDKKLDLTVASGGNGVHGVLQHNYCEYLNSASYNVARTSDGLNIAFSSNGHQARITATVLKNKLKVELVHDDMPDLVQLKVPATASFSLERSPENAPTKELRTMIAVAQKMVFNLTYSCSQYQSSVKTSKLSMQNSLLPILPESVRWSVSITDNSMEYEAGINLENVKVSAKNSIPESGYLEISHDIDILDMAFIPRKTEIAYNSGDELGMHHLNLDIGDKKTSLDIAYASSGIRGTMLNQGFQALPKKTSIEVDFHLTDNGAVVDVTATWNENTYSLNLKGSSNFKPTSRATIIPYVKHTGKQDFSLVLSENGRNRLTVTSLTAITSETVSHEYEIEQDLNQYIPSHITEKLQITISDKEILMSRNITESGSQVLLVYLHYLPGKLQYNYTSNNPYLPEYIGVEYDGGLDNIFVKLTLKDQDEVNSASMSYNIGDDSSFHIEGKHTFNTIEFIVPKLMKFGFERYSGPGEIKATYLWGSDEGTIKFWKRSVADMGMSFESQDGRFNLQFAHHSGEISFNTSFIRDGHEYSLKLKSGFQANLESSENMLWKVYIDGDITLDDKYAISRNLLELEGKMAFINITSKQNMFNELPENYRFVRNISWDLHSNSADLRIEGTEDDPFFFKVMMGHVKFDSVSMRMQHSQQSWKDLPQDLFVTLQRISEEQNAHAVTLSVTADDWTKTIKANLKYAIQENSISFDGTMDNDLLSEYFKHFGLHLDGKKVDSGLNWDISMIMDDKMINETFELDNVNIFGDVKFAFHRKQNIFTDLPEDLTITMLKTSGKLEANVTYDQKGVYMKLLYLSTEVGLSIAQTSYFGTVPFNINLKWGTGPRNLEISHNLDVLDPLPRHFRVQTELDQDLTNLNVYLDTNDKKSQFSVQRLVDDTSIELVFQHNIDILYSEYKIPKHVQFVFRSLPVMLSLKWDSMRVIMEKLPQGFRFQQNVLDILPRDINILCRCDMSDPRKHLELNAVIGPYTLQYESNLEAVESFNMDLEWKFFTDEDILFHLNMTTKLAVTEGFENITFAQGLTNSLPESFSYSMKYKVGYTSGYISFATVLEEPVNLNITYSKIQDNEFHFGIVHNVEELSPMLSFETTGSVVTNWSDMKKSFDASISSSEERKTFSFSLLTDIQSQTKEVSLIIAHDFDVLEAYFKIPRNSKLSLYVSDGNYEVLASYSMDSEEKFAKLHTSIEESEIHITLSQNIIESSLDLSNTRKKASLEFPHKIILRLTTDGNTYKSSLSFRSRQKRKYFNVEYSSKQRQSWKIQVNQNLNNVLDLEMPTDLGVEVTLNETAMMLDLKWDDSKYHFTTWLERKEQSGKVGFSSMHTFSPLSNLGIPADVSFNMERSTIDGNSVLRAFFKVDDSSVNLAVERTGGSGGTEIVVGVTGDSSSISATTKVLFLNAGFDFSVTGNQVGFTMLPQAFNVKLNASYDMDTQLSGYASHNINALQNLGLPKLTRAIIKQPRFISGNSLSTGFSFQIDDVEYSMDLKLVRDTNNVAVSASGIRTKNSWSTSTTEKIAYEGKWVLEMYEDSKGRHFSTHCMYEETNLENDITLQNEAQLQLDIVTDSVTLNASLNLPFCTYFTEPINFMAMFLRGEDSIKFNSSYSRGDYNLLLLAKLENNLVLHSSDGDSQIHLVFDNVKEKQLVFYHNIKHKVFGYVPNNVTVSVGKMKTVVQVTRGDADLLIVIQPYHLELTYTSATKESVSILAEYSSHPSHRIIGSIRIVPLNVDVSADAQIQFFRPKDGKSFVSIAVLNKRTQRGFFSSAHAHLEDSDIRDINFVVNVKSNFTSAPVDFTIEYALDNNPFHCRFSVQLKEYSVRFNMTSDSFSTLVVLPKQYKVNALLLETSCRNTEQHHESNILIQWNRSERISLKTTSESQPDNQAYRFEAYQPFAEPSDLSVDYQLKKRNGWYITKTSITANDEPSTMVTEYLHSMQQDTSTHKLVVDIQQSCLGEYVPKAFTTSGVIQYGVALYDSDWKVSSAGHDIIILKNHLETTSGGFNAKMNWKHPFEDLFLTLFDASMDFQASSNLLEIHADVSHSEESKYIPSHFITTGRVAYSNVLYDSDWKIMSDGEELVILKKVFRITEDGYQVTINWRQPFEELAPRFYDMDILLKLQSDTMKLNADISHPFSNDFIPQHFLTTGMITVGRKRYDSDWKISSAGEDIVILQKSFEASDDGFNMQFRWKQPHDEFTVTLLESSLNFLSTSSSSRLTGSLQYNDIHRMTGEYTSVSNAINSKNITLGVTYNDERYEDKLYYALEQGQKHGAKFTLLYDSLLPENSILTRYVPNKEHVSITIFKKGSNMHFTARYISSLMKNPAVLSGMYLISDGKTLLNSSLTFTRSSALMDAEVRVIIDRLEGITIANKVPSLGFDQSIKITYDKQTMRLGVAFSLDGQEPIVININLQNIVPHFNEMVKLMKQKDFLPKIKLITNLRHTPFDAYIGLQINDASYTLHLTTGYDDLQQGYLNITTKRNFIELDTLLSITASVVDSNNVRIAIQTSKRLSHFLNYALSSSTAELKDKAVMITDALTKILGSLDGVIDGSESVERIIAKNKDTIIKQIAEAEHMSVELISNLNSGILEYAHDMENEISSGAWKAVTLLSMVVQNLQNIIKRPIQELRQDYLTKISTEFYDHLQPILQPSIQALSQVHMGQLALELAQEGITKLVFVMVKNAEVILSAARGPLAELVEVSETKVIFNIPLHVPVKGLIAPPSVSDIAMWIAQSSLAHEIKAKLEFIYKAVDLYYQYRSILNMPIDELIPPFKGHAEISGFKHIHTFDGKTYDYMSSCESKHILVQDIRNQEFKMIVAYGSVPSITVVTSDPLGREQSVVLSSDYSVTDEEGREITIPMDYADVSVRRTGDVLTLHTTYGLTVSCNFVSDICTVDVSAFYFAGLVGMMGTFNNEINDENVGPGLSKVDDVARAWMLPGACIANNALTKCTQSSSKTCTKLFEGRDSDFFSCFPVENPEPYKRMCLSDTCSNAAGICTAVASYARRCALKGVNLPIPSSCLTCNSVAGDVFTSDKEVTVSGADVVFVIEKAGCVRFRKKDYKKMLTELHSSLNETVASGNVNYGVVGFGGPNSLAVPHSVTFGKELFMPTSQDLSNSEERALLTALKRGEKSNSESDILQALTYASQLPFRAGASRAIVLLTCDVCSAQSEVDRSYVQKLLQEQGIVIHHLRQQNIQAGRNSKKVFGFNSREIFAKSPNTNLVRSELKVSGSDQCLPVIDVSGGSVWNSNTFSRESLHLIVNEISRGVNEVGHQECVCEPSVYGSATAKCTSS